MAASWSGRGIFLVSAVIICQFAGIGVCGERLAWLLDLSEFESQELSSIRGVSQEYQRLRSVLIAGGFEPADVVYEPVGTSAEVSAADGHMEFPGQVLISRQMAGSMKRPELLLVCLAGTMVRVDGQAMLCLRRSNPEDASTMLSVRQLQQRLHGAWNLAEQTVVVLDVGRNPWFRGGSVNLLRDLQRLEAESVSLGQCAAASGGMFWISTCSSGERSMVSETEGRGVYLEALTMALEGAADGYGEVSDNFVSLREAVVFADERTQLFVSATLGGQQRSWHAGSAKSDLILTRAARQHSAASVIGNPADPRDFAMLSGPLYESARTVSGCCEFLRAGQLSMLKRSAAEASRLDPANQQLRRLQLLAQLCARQSTEALELMTEMGEGVWVPVGDQAVVIEAGESAVDVAEAGDFLRTGELSKSGSETERYVQIISIKDGGTAVTREISGQVPLVVLRKQMLQIEAVDWVQQMSDRLQLSPRVIHGFVLSYVAAVGKIERLQRSRGSTVGQDSQFFLPPLVGGLPITPPKKGNEDHLPLVESVLPGQFEKNQQRFRRILLAQ